MKPLSAGETPCDSADAVEIESEPFLECTKKRSFLGLDATEPKNDNRVQWEKNGYYGNGNRYGSGEKSLRS